MKYECVQCLPDQMDYVFNKEPILWLNSSLHFTLESAKVITDRLLQKLPHYEKHPLLLHKGLTVENDPSPVEGISPLEILVYDANKGASTVASKLCGEYKGIVTINKLDISNLSMQHGRKETVMILYLNSKVFRDEDTHLHESIKLLIDEGIPRILVHEKDTNKGGCPLETIITQTRADLKGEVHNIYTYGTVADLYSGYQQVSLRQILIHIGTKLTGDTVIKARMASTIMRTIRNHRLS